MAATSMIVVVPLVEYSSKRVARERGTCVWKRRQRPGWSWQRSACPTRALLDPRVCFFVWMHVQLAPPVHAPRPLWVMT